MFCFVKSPSGLATRRFAPLLLITLLGAGCGALPDESECTAASDCDAGFECREGKCVVAGAIACAEVTDCEAAKDKGSWKPGDMSDCQEIACVKKTCQVTSVADGQVCNDDLEKHDGVDTSCTAGACIAGHCEPAKSVNKDKCFIGGQGKPKQGVCANKGDKSEANDCDACAPEIHPWAWSPMAKDSACEGDNDTGDCGIGRCDGQSKCVSNAHVPKGRCCIGCAADKQGTCAGEGDANGTNVCELCNPAGSKTGWTSAMPGTDCKDDDGLACTSGGCDTQGTCGQQKVADDACVVDEGGAKVCKTKDDQDQGGCQVCDPGQTQEAWTPLASGATCTHDEFPCTVDACDGKGACATTNDIAKGACFIEVDGSKTCLATGDSKKGSGGCFTCDPNDAKANQVSWSQLAKGATCGIDGKPCLAATCNDVGGCVQKEVKKGYCYIAPVGLSEPATCFNDGQLDPANECQRCDASDPVKVKIDAWTPAANETACQADGIDCTTDLCDGKGKCEHTAKDDLCNNAKGPCQKNACNVAAKLCKPVDLGETEPCPGPDGVTCTVEFCDGKGSCSDTGKADDKKCDDKIACSLDVCDPTKGCIHTPEAEKHCGDGNVCTDDVCDLTKGCLHPHNKSPCKTDDLACTLEACLDGKCDKKIDAGHCVIDSKSCANKDAFSPDGCDTCNPTTDQNKWTPTAPGSKCDGDGVACTSDACDGMGECISKLAADKCLIDKACYSDGDLKAGSGKCQRCDAKTKTAVWTAVAKDTQCEQDGVGCTVDRCDGAGGCKHTVDNLLCKDNFGCTNNVCDAKLGCQFIDNCAWGHFCNQDADACTTKAPVILVKQDKDNAAPTNPAAVRHVVDSKTGKRRLWVVYQSQSCATASDGAWTIDKGAKLRALVLDSHSHVDKAGKDVPMSLGGTQKPPTMVTLPAELKGKSVCQGFPVVAADPESSSQAWVSWLEAGVGGSPECLKNGGQGGVLRLGLLDGSAVPDSGVWGKVAGKTCTAGKFSGPLLLTGALGLLSGPVGISDATKRGIVSVRSQGGDLVTWDAQKFISVGAISQPMTSKVSTSANEFAQVHVTLVDLGKQSKNTDGRYIALAAALDAKQLSLWSATLNGTGAKGPTATWLKPDTMPAKGGLKGISTICSLDATFNSTTGEVGVALVARESAGGMDDRVYLVTKKGADAAKVVAIEENGTVGTAGACHYGMTAARIAATAKGFAIVYYGADNPGDPGKPTVADVSFVAGKAMVKKHNISGMSIWATDTSAQAKSVPALAWRGIGDLISNPDGTLSIVAEVKKVAERGLAIFTFKP